MNETDAELVAAARAGDESAWEAIMHRHWSAIRGHAWRLLRDADEADDVAQLTFVRAHAARRRLAPDTNLGALLHRIAYNGAMDVLRRRQLRRSMSWDGPIHDQLALASPADRPDEATIRADEAAAAWRAMDRLTGQRARTLLVLSIIDGLSYGDIATIMGMTVTAIKSATLRAREDLRAAYATEVA